MNLQSQANEIYKKWFGDDMGLQDDNGNVQGINHIRTIDQLEAMRGKLSAGEFDAIEAALNCIYYKKKY